MSIEVIIFLTVVFGIAGGLVLERFRSQIDAAEQRKIDMTVPALSFRGQRSPDGASTDGVEKLRIISDAHFMAKRLLSDNEAHVLGEIESIIAEIEQPWRVLGQVGLSRFIAASSADGFAVIDSMYVALLIIDANRDPIAAVEYQASAQDRSENAVRDAVKREAMRRAGISYFEVRTSDRPGTLRNDIMALVQRRVPSEESAAVETPIADQPPAARPPRAPPKSRKRSPAAPRKPRGRPASGVKP